jgi:hypothetical protein
MREVEQRIIETVIAIDKDDIVRGSSLERLT